MRKSKKISTELRVSKQKGFGNHYGTSKNVEYVLLHTGPFSTQTHVIWLSPAEARTLAEYIKK